MIDHTSIIPKGWKTTTLGEVLFPVSNTFNFNGVDKVHFLNTGDILDGKLLHQNLSLAETLPGQAKKKFKLNDILYSEIRPANKRFMLVNFESSNSVASTKLMVLRTRENIDVNYIYKYITSREMLNEFQTIAESRSGTFPQITFDSISNLVLSLPSPAEQRAITAVLSSLDDKIELLREQNKTLEATAQSIFKEWFVNFNFPRATGKMINSELGQIPEGWRAYELKELVKQIKPGTNYQPERLENGIPFVNGRNVKNGFLELNDITYISKNEYERVHQAWMPEENDILITRIGTLGNVGIIRKEDMPLAVHYNSIVIKQGLLNFQFLFFLFKSKMFQEKFHMNKKQAVQEFVTIESVEQIEIALPTNPGLISELILCFDCLFNKIKNNHNHIITLSALRDALLPKLMKGEVRAKVFNN